MLVELTNKKITRIFLLYIEKIKKKGIKHKILTGGTEN
jgi:hypothetical protein